MLLYSQQIACRLACLLLIPGYCYTSSAEISDALPNLQQSEPSAEPPTDIQLVADPNSSPNELGIVAQRPDKGPYVETRFGFMVPYRQPVPGTEIFIEMIPIPGKSFLMGSPANADYGHDDERPQNEVSVSPFWIAKTETTWAQVTPYFQLRDVFKKFQRDGIRKVDDHNGADAVTVASDLYDPSLTYGDGDAPDTPAATMTPYSAKQFTKWLSLSSGVLYRLPYESEWEYACRAGSTTAWHFGDDPAKLKEYAWYEENSNNKRQAVAQLKPNAFGLHDMHGNVAEWVLDQYQDDWYQSLQQEMNLIPESTYRWPDKTFPRVARGGSWELDADACRSSFRLASDDDKWKDEDPNLPQSPWWYTSSPATGVGFRIIRPLLEPSKLAQRQVFWEATVEEIKSTVEMRIYQEGRGSIGIVDPQLPDIIKRMDK